jgi:hypothetical protein
VRTQNRRTIAVDVIKSPPNVAKTIGGWHSGAPRCGRWR